MLQVTTSPMTQLSPLSVPSPQAASVAELSSPSALPHLGSSPAQEPSAGSPGWQANPVAQTVAAASTQLPADLQRPNLLSSSSHVQVRHIAMTIKQLCCWPAMPLTFAAASTPFSQVRSHHGSACFDILWLRLLRLVQHSCSELQRLNLM